MAAYESTVNKKLAELLKEIEKFTKGKIDNTNSKSQLSRFLFEQINLMPIGPKGKNGHYSVSSEVLNKLVPQHEIARALLVYNALNKVKSTFIKALKKTNPVTGRLHTSFNQTVTETGRLSSSNPHLQNIPSRTTGKLLREFFVAPEGFCPIGADYSNIELRVMAIYGAAVIIPILKELRVIIDKYKADLPKPYTNQVMNRYLKELGQLAGLDDSFNTYNNKGTGRAKSTFKKWELISTHTARRSFATNMYRRGIDPMSIMMITGHSSEKVFMGYIKISGEENAQRFLDKNDH